MVNLSYLLKKHLKENGNGHILQKGSSKTPKNAFQKIMNTVLIIVSLILLPSILFGASNQKPFEIFVSLGNSCVTRMQINHHLTSRYQKPINAFGGGQLFDWVVIHDYEKLVKAIKNDLSDLFERSDLALVDHEFKCVKNLKYQITWSHLFERNPDKTLPENIIEMQYENKKQKIDYLTKKFKRLKRYRTLYILSYPFIENTTDTIKPGKSLLIRLSRALKKFRRNDNFAILFCTVDKEFKSFDNIIVHKINPWDRSDSFDKRWDKILSKFPFSYEKLKTDTSLHDNSWVN